MDFLRSGSAPATNLTELTFYWTELVSPSHKFDKIDFLRSARARNLTDAMVHGQGRSQPNIVKGARKISGGPNIYHLFPNFNK